MAAAASNDPFKDYLRVQRKFDAKIFKILEGVAEDIEDRLAQLDLDPRVGAKTRAAQLRIVQAEIRATQRDMWASIGQVAQQGRKEAAEAAADALDYISRVAYASLAPEAAQTLVDGLRASAQAGINSLYARVPRQLSEAVYRNGVVASGKIENLIRSGIVQGLSAKELAKTVYSFVSPTTPGGASYAAMRLARTEINNAFHEQQIKTAQAPGVKGVKWNLSSSHPRPDECNLYAERDSYKLGAGVYSAENVPKKPHPHCFCYLTYVTMDPDEFSAALRSGKFDDELRRRTALNMEKLKEAAVPTSKPAAAKRTRTARQRTEASGAKAAKPKLQRLKKPKLAKGKDILLEPGFKPKVSSMQSMYYDNYLMGLLEKQGFNARPGVTTVSSDFDALIGQGWTEVFRGTRGGAGETAAQAVRSFAYDDDYFPGTGIYGNGIYTSVDSRVAKSYAGDRGETYRLAIDPGAKVANYYDLLQMQNKDLDMIQQKMRAAQGTPNFAALANWYTMMTDAGRYAAAKGYDIVYVPSSDDGAIVEINGEKVRTKLDQFVILNRSAVVVEFLL